MYASAERELITGFWGRAPAGSRGRAKTTELRRSPPEADSILAFERICLCLYYVCNFVFLDCTISHFGLDKLHLGLHKLVGLHA